MKGKNILPIDRFKTQLFNEKILPMAVTRKS
jgi:hypothetical protein